MFIVFLITRVGGPDGRILDIGNNDDDVAFGYMVVFGYTFIVLVQFVGVILGEELNVQVK